MSACGQQQSVRLWAASPAAALAFYVGLWATTNQTVWGQVVAPAPAPLVSAVVSAVPAGTDSEAERRAELRRVLDRNAPILEAQAAVLKAAAKLVGPSVVHIEADVPQRVAARDRQLEEAGSGIIVERGGKFYVITNRHVFRDAPAEDVRIHLADGRVLHPRRILDDTESDVGVLPIEADHLIAATIGDSDRMEVGDFVLAFGSPFGLSHSVTFGIVSGKGRRDLRLGESHVRFQNFLQTDAAINPGNSGGPLCNIHGEIIGINTAIASNSGINEGIGFAIPIKMFMVVANQLIDHGKVIRAFLGLSLDGKFGPEAAAEIGLLRPGGARINALTKGAPAEAAGLQVGDVVLQFDGTPVEDDSHLVYLVGITEVGRKVPLEIFRDGKRLNYTLETVASARFGQ